MTAMPTGALRSARKAKSVARRSESTVPPIGTNRIHPYVPVTSPEPTGPAPLCRALSQFELTGGLSPWRAPLTIMRAQTVLVVGETPSLGRSVFYLLVSCSVPCRFVHDVVAESPLFNLAERFPIVV